MYHSNQFVISIQCFVPVNSYHIEINSELRDNPVLIKIVKRINRCTRILLFYICNHRSNIQVVCLCNCINIKLTKYLYINIYQFQYVDLMTPSDAFGDAGRSEGPNSTCIVTYIEENNRSL